jgi:hypothetical protein
MKLEIPDEKFKKIKNFIFQNGRLIERTLFEYFFENGTKKACIKALCAYQNPDGGFGNGIEPDLLCPQSSAIGAETALYILDLLDYNDSPILDTLVPWIISNLNEDGFIPHPPSTMMEYPHQSWWENPDNERILSIIGLLRKIGMDRPDLLKMVKKYFMNLQIPFHLTYYDYPYFVYLKHCNESNKLKNQLKRIIEQLPMLLEKYADHYPLFARSWYHALDYCKPPLIEREAHKFIANIHDDGSIETPYPDLPWWTPIITLDGLIILHKLSMI